ncbi:30S ribosomal protein S7 [Halanaerobiaceae bacterium Z-7014]|uniref:Small ribosomal subunit protein uS7 n=1 Tax=Halonatronomonas betaini TaxID=2778430 RepID=A0A931B072_9FIRM|nr:30S ribosomal protein S7 [Halonatronomonas betaini]MBF8438008.1 30S ribosomal protein S7 [Halonatronomonas betaini]
MRKNRAERRTVKPDPVYNDVIINRIINKIMLDGKKSLAEKVVYEALDIVSEETGEEPLEVVKEALDNIMPVLEVRSRRVGGSNYQVPVEVDENRKLSLGLRWFVQSTRKRGERTIVERVAGELMDAYNNTGGAVRKKEEVHRMAEANRAFAHYRW